MFVIMTKYSLLTGDHIDLRFKKVRASNHYLSNKKTEANPSTNNDVTSMFPNKVSYHLFTEQYKSYEKVVKNLSII